MLAVISGTVLKAYSVDVKDRNGDVHLENRVDLYDGDSLVRVRKTPDSLSQGDVVDLRCKLYSNDFGISAVFDSLA